MNALKRMGIKMLMWMLATGVIVGILIAGATSEGWLGVMGGLFLGFPIGVIFYISYSITTGSEDYREFYREVQDSYGHPSNRSKRP